MDLSDRGNLFAREPTSVLDLRSPSPPSSSTPSPEFEEGSSRFRGAYAYSKKRRSAPPPQVEEGKYSGKNERHYIRELPTDHTFQGKFREQFRMSAGKKNVLQHRDSSVSGERKEAFRRDEEDGNARSMVYMGELQQMLIEDTNSLREDVGLFGSEEEKPDSWSISHDSMELDSGGSTSGMDDLESMLLLSSSPAPDNSLMKWLLGDNRAGQGTKVDRVDHVDHVMEYNPQHIWNSGVEVQSTFNSHPTSQLMTFLPNDSTGPQQNGSVNGSESFPLHGPQCVYPSSPLSFCQGPSLQAIPFMQSDSEAVPSRFLSNSCPFSGPISYPPRPPHPPVPTPDSLRMPAKFPEISQGGQLPHVLPSCNIWSRQNSLPSPDNSTSSLQLPTRARSLSQDYSRHLPADRKLLSSMSVDESYPFGYCERGLQPRISATPHSFGSEGLHHTSTPLGTLTSSFCYRGENYPTSQPIARSECVRGEILPTSGGGGGTQVPNSHLIAKSDEILPTFQPIAGRGKGDFDAGVVAVNFLLKVAVEIERGNMDNAKEILVRLDELIFPGGENSLHRVSFYFTKALVARILGHASPLAMTTTESHEDVCQKVAAYKRFCEVSPLPQFAYFTSNQTILEALEEEELIHVIDFEVGLGVQWASFLQDLVARPSGKPPRLRLTVVGSASHEVRSTGQSLCQLAESLDLPLEFRVVNCPWEHLSLSSLELREGEAVAVNFVLSLHRLLHENSSESLNSVLSVVRETRPKVVTVVELEANHNVSLFHERFVEALQYYTFVFDSLNAGGETAERGSLEEMMMIENFLLAPQIVNIVSCEGNDRIRRHEKLRLWRTRLRAAGFHVLPLSDRNTLQADYVLSSVDAWRGRFKITKEEGSLMLSWQERPLMAASAWRC